MARRRTSAVAESMRVKLLADDLAEGKSEAIVVVPGKRAEELLLAKHARRVNIDDFVFDKKAA
jgi:hypothetical protein